MDKKVCGVIPILSFLVMLLLLIAGIIFFFCMYRALEILEVIQVELDTTLPNIGVYKIFVVLLCFALLILLSYNLCYSVFGDSERNSYLVRAGPSFLIIVLTVLLQLLFLLVLTTMAIGWLITDLMLANAPSDDNGDNNEPSTTTVAAYRYKPNDYRYSETEDREGYDYAQKNDYDSGKQGNFHFIGNPQGPFKYHVQEGDAPEVIRIAGRETRDVSLIEPYFAPVLMTNYSGDLGDYVDLTEEALRLLRLFKRQDPDNENGGGDTGSGDDDGGADNSTMDTYHEDYTPELASTGYLLFQIAAITNILIILFLGMLIMIRVYNFQYMYVDSCVLDMYDDNCCTTSSQSTRTDCCD